MKNLLTIALCFISLGVFAQMQVDKKIEMTGATSADKKIEGIEEVVNSHDAVNKEYVDTAITNRGGGLAGPTVVSISCDTVYMSDGSFLIIPGAFFAYALAGDDQLDVPGGTTVQLNAKTPHYGTGTWTVLGGTPGGNFSNANDPKATFTGNPSTSYNIKWEVSSNCSSDSDEITVSFGIIPPKRVFVTSVKYDGILGGLSGADAKCQARADAVGLGGTWTAWISTASVDARDRVTQSANTYALLNGTTIANDWNDLVDGSLLHEINITELGNGTSDFVWTNTLIDGTSEGSSDCSGWTSDSGYGELGYAAFSNSLWTDESLSLCTGQRALYCFED